MEEITIAAPSLVYLNANKSFSGSCGGMWYRLGMEGNALRACVWPMPWCFEKTDEAEKTFADFAPDADGLAAARAWIAGQYEQQRPRWSAAPVLPPLQRTDAATDGVTDEATGEATDGARGEA